MNGQKTENNATAHNSSAANCYAGSEFIKVNENITLGCISPEARNLLDTIMAEWEKHLIKLKKSNGENYEPSHYGFAYWLVRWSGLIQPA